MTERVERKHDRPAAAGSPADRAALAEARFADVQAVAHIGSWEWTIAADSECWWWSDEMFRLCGFEPGAFAPTFESLNAAVHPDDRERVLAQIQKALSERAPFAFAHRIVRPDGQVRALYAQGRVALDEENGVTRMAGTAHDVTEREAALRLTERRLQAVINAEPACVKLVSRDGRLLDMNPAGLAMIDARDISELVGRSIIDLVHPEDYSRFLEMHQAAYNGTPARAEYRIIGLSGRERWVESRSVPFEASNSERVVLSVTNDVTERKGLEEQLRQSQKMEAVGRLAGGIAHDFNNLLTVIGGYTETTLAQMPPNTAAATALREVIRAAESAAALTQQLLTFSRKQLIRLRPLDLNGIITDVEQLLRRTLGEDIEIITSLPANVRPIQADATQLQQVLMNMAVNARDAMPHGGVLSIETRNVGAEGRRRSGHASGDAVELRVSDTGCGMDQSTKAHLFEPFFTTKQLGYGAGLGLATVYAIVESMGGTIDVTSELGRGTTFELRFPASPTPVERLPLPRVPAPAASLQGTETILLVEDDDTVRGYAASVLKNAGYEVIEAARPAIALRMASQRESAIHLLLSDLIMPGFDGVELTKRFHLSHPDTPVLFMSGYSDDIMARHGLTTEQYALLTKPFSTNHLLMKVREVLGQAN